MGACLFLLRHLPDVLILSLTISGEAWLLMWLYLLLSGMLIALWTSLALKISSSSRYDTPQAYGLVTMLLLWLAEQTIFFLLAKQHR